MQSFYKAIYTIRGANSGMSMPGTRISRNLGVQRRGSGWELLDEMMHGEGIRSYQGRLVGFQCIVHVSERLSVREVCRKTKLHRRG